MAATTVLAASLCPPGPPRAGWVAMADGIIQEVGDGRAPSGAVDLGDALLAPGLVDLQVNGVGEVDLGAATPAEWQRACDALLAHGVTGWCPAFVSAPRDAYDALLERMAAAREAAEARGSTSTILGAHLEGPFLGGVPGAHAPEHLSEADTGWLAALLDRHPGTVRLVTLAPEADPGFGATRLLRDAGVVVALGHSDASYAGATEAADAGATVVTHLFDAMSVMHHREPGLAGAALDDDRLTPTLIADLAHVHPAALRLAIERKPNVALISDAVAAPRGTVAGEPVRTPGGRLAGATTMLDRAVANVVSLGVPVPRAIAMATAVPASVLGLADRGRIAPGVRADLVAFDPDPLRVLGVWVGAAHVHGTEAMPVQRSR